MFSNIKHGWADFDFKGFKGVCSYIQDPVKDICKALTGTDESKIITVEMDEEGSEWFLSIAPNEVRVYREGNPLEVRTSRHEFVKEFVNDVYRDIELGSKWRPDNDPDEALSDIENNLFDVVYHELLRNCYTELNDWEKTKLKQLIGKNIFCCAYEFTYKYELLTILENSDFDLSTYIWLFNKDYPLDYLYQTWIKDDATVTDILTNMILEEKRRELNNEV